MSQKFSVPVSRSLTSRKQSIEPDQQIENNRIAAKQKAKHERNCADRTVIGRYSCWTWNLSKIIYFWTTSSDKRFEKVCTKGHRILTTATVQWSNGILWFQS
jgi:hypothetical protein